MNQPTIEQFNELQKRVQHLEGEIGDWQDWKFITRDSSHKIGLAEGLTLGLQRDLLELKVSFSHVARKVDAIEEKLGNHDEQFEKLDKKLDLILGFLQPRRE